jgi:hypothetical protein
LEWKVNRVASERLQTGDKHPPSDSIFSRKSKDFLKSIDEIAYITEFSAVSLGSLGFSTPFRE